MRSIPQITPVVLFAALLSASSITLAASGGDGGPINGPMREGAAIPSQPDWSMDLRQLETLSAQCVFEASRALWHQVYPGRSKSEFLKAATVPGAGVRTRTGDFGVEADASPEGSHLQIGYFNPYGTYRPELRNGVNFEEMSTGASFGNLEVRDYNGNRAYDHSFSFNNNGNVCFVPESLLEESARIGTPMLACAYLPGQARLPYFKFQPLDVVTEWGPGGTYSSFRTFIKKVTIENPDHLRGTVSLEYGKLPSAAFELSATPIDQEKIRAAADERIRSVAINVDEYVDCLRSGVSELEDSRR